MSQHFTVWSQFILLAAIISYAGFKLSFLADQISEKTGLGRNLIGILMLSTVTSLPELVTGISSVTINDNPNLAVGDVLGSCCFNLVTVVLLDLIYKKGSVYSRNTQGHMLSGLMGILLIGFAGFSLILSREPWFNLGPIGLSTVFIPIIYLMAMRAIYNFEKSSATIISSEIAPAESLKQDYLKFAFFALLIMMCGSFLPSRAEKIIDLMNWNATFMGTFFVALVTSFPEISVTISALRINAAELAFSNLLGSSIFNILILAIDDVFYTKGPLLTAVSDTHAVTAFSALMMTGLVMIALMKPPQRKFLNIISGMSFLLLLVYVLTVVIAFNGN